MDNQDRNRYKRSENWRWESEEVKRPKVIQKTKSRQSSKQLIRSGRFDADELYEEE